MKYLIDEALLVESAVEEEVNESSGKKEKNYYIQGVFSTPGQKNRNGRIYPMNIWEREVQKYQNYIANNAVETLGEWEHPSRSSVDPLQAVMKMVEVKMDNGLVMGKAKILNNNSEKTNQLKALIDEGMKIGVSSRGVGSVKGDVVENFNLITWDAVASPSDYNSNLTGICESMQDKNFLITESGEIKEVQIEPIIENEIANTLDEAINNKNWTNLKEFMRKQPGFNSWEFEGDYETLIVGYKTPKQASQAFSNSNKSSNEITSYGDDFWIQGKNIYVVLSDEAKKALDVNESVSEKKELSESEKAELRDTIINKFKDLFSSSLNEGIKVNSKMSAIQVLQMAMSKISDEKTKDMINSAINFLAKEFNVNIEKVNEAKMMKSKFKKGQVVKFYDPQGKN